MHACRPLTHAHLRVALTAPHSAGGDDWRVRRRAVGPSMHRAYLEEMIDRVFSESALRLNTKLADAAAAGKAVNIEASFSQLTLDVIGKAVFNYDFDSLTKDSPIIQAVRPPRHRSDRRTWQRCVHSHAPPSTLNRPLKASPGPSCMHIDPVATLNILSSVDDALRSSKCGGAGFGE